MVPASGHVDMTADAPDQSPPDHSLHQNQNHQRRVRAPARMELKIVYRILRKISAWTIGGWYSEVHLDGAKNVPRTGPLIVACTHHNEMIDIATLSATIPHGRHLCFWAKSSMFKHPIGRFIMESSGAIRVQRNPNRAPISSLPPPDESNGSSSDNAESRNTVTQADLFKDTSRALAKGEVVGVFPEGTSYTLPAIAQVLPGAAWAAVEYARAVQRERLAGLSEKEKLHLRGKEEKIGLKVVPVGIVYEDKRRYLSRVSVRFGEPIDLDEYTEELFDWKADPEEAAKSVVKKLNAEIEKRLIGLTVNAPDWESLYAARTAMKILWKNQENVGMEYWVETSQNLVNLFASSEPSAKLEQVRKSLMRYYALLHYTGIEHAILEDVLPISSTTLLGNNLRAALLLRASARIVVGLPFALLRLVAFAPALISHLPGYLFSQIAVKMFYTPGEEETEAQYRSLGGGFGLGISTALALSTLWRMNALTNWNFFSGSLGEDVKRFLGLFGLVYGSVSVLVNWHLLLVKGNLRQFRRLMAFAKLVLGALLPGRLRPEQLQAYSRPPPPPVNIFIKKDAVAPSTDTLTPAAAPISPSKLVRELLTARLQAYINLGNYLRNLDRAEMTVLLSQGARVPSVVS